MCYTLTHTRTHTQTCRSMSVRDQNPGSPIPPSIPLLTLSSTSLTRKGKENYVGTHSVLCFISRNLFVPNGLLTWTPDTKSSVRTLRKGCEPGRNLLIQELTRKYDITLLWKPLEPSLTAIKHTPYLHWGAPVSDPTPSVGDSSGAFSERRTLHMGPHQRRVQHCQYTTYWFPGVS